MEDPTPTSAVSDNYLHEGCQLYCPIRGGWRQSNLYYHIYSLWSSPLDMNNNLQNLYGH